MRWDDRDREYGGRGDFRPNEFSDFNRGDYVRAGTGLARPYDDRGTPSRPSFRGRGPKNYKRDDARILEDVCDRLDYDDAVDASDIEVRVQDGVVTLDGTVADRFQKRRAEDVADSVSGVRDIENNLRVTRA